MSDCIYLWRVMLIVVKLTFFITMIHLVRELLILSDLLFFIFCTLHDISLLI